MVKPRPHWSLLLAIAAFAAYFALVASYWLYPPASLGMTMDYAGPIVRVAEVRPGSPAARAGVAPRSRVVAVNGVPVRGNADIRVHQQHVRAGGTEVWVFERPDGRPDTIALQTPPRSSVLISSGPLPGVLAATMLMLVVLGVVIALKLPRQPYAILGAAFLASLGVTSAPMLPRGMVAAWRALPLPLGALLFVPCFASLLAAPFFFLFACWFPHAPRRRWLPWVAVAPALLALVPFARAIIALVYAPASETARAIPAWLNVAGPLIVPAYLAAGCVVLALRYRRITDLNDRRRLRVITAGAFVGAMGLVLVGLGVIANTTGTPNALMRAFMFSGPAYGPAVLLFLVLPFSFAYAIVRHRLLDVRLIIRQGVRYAIARGALLSIVPVALALLAADLFRHGSVTLGAVLESRGWLYAGVAAVAMAAHAKRGSWTRELDRRFFRDRYEADKILRSVVADVRGAPDFGVAAAAVVARIETALHPRFVAALTAPGAAVALTTRTIAPERASRVTVPAGAKVRQLASILGKPIVVGGDGSGLLARQLPVPELAELTAQDVDLLVPVPARGAEVALALGSKRAEEPYTGEDLELLQAIADALSLLPFETAPSLSPPSGLIPLGPRYRATRLIGRGGMGAVYEARDTALERDVAVKVVREDLLESPVAAARFREEALAAAAFSHPNVVTVHDYVGFEGRAFLVMELLRGRTLRDALREERRFDVARVKAVIADVCAAVDAAHVRQLVHRDLKPENIFLVSDGGPAKVLDFGIATIAPPGAGGDAVTVTVDVIGTLPYMAPEQVAGGAASPAWDLWALGVVAYEMLVGAHPFDAAPPLERVDAMRQGRYAQPSAVLAGAGPGWDAFFARAFNPDANARFASARVFAAAAATA